jgi:drug/metabolite transporter (DMT)-like permease
MAIVLVSQQPAVSQQALSRETTVRRNRAGIRIALVSGVAIGLFFIALAQTNATAGLWPLVASRSTSVVLFGSVAVVGGRSVRMPPRFALYAAAGGAIDVTANVLYLIATRGGPLGIVVTLASLYPASTVVLARIVLAERLSSLQRLGIACAMVAVVLIVGA